jgi:hypothetical protein
MVPYCPTASSRHEVPKQTPTMARFAPQAPPLLVILDHAQLMNLERLWRLRHVVRVSQ